MRGLLVTVCMASTLLTVGSLPQTYFNRQVQPAAYQVRTAYPGAVGYVPRTAHQVVVPQQQYTNSYTPAVATNYAPAIATNQYAASRARTAPAAPAAPAYNTVPATNSYQATKKYEATNKYEAKPLPLDEPAEKLVYEALTEIRKQGELVLKVTDKLATNPLINSVIGADKSSADSCSMSMAEISPTLRRLINAVIMSQDELVAITRAAQAIKRDEKDSTKALKMAIESVNLATPLAPKFEGVFVTKPGCESASFETASKDLGKISRVVGAVAQTDLFTRDQSVKDNLKKVSAVTRTVSKTTESLSKQNFANLCQGSLTFNSDVLSGLSEIFDSFSEVLENFGTSDNETSEKIKKASVLIQDGATLFSDFTFEDESSPNQIPRSSSECKTDLSSVTSTLNDVADLVEIIGPELEELQS